MNLRESIIAQRSKPQCDEIVAWVGGNSKRFSALIDIFKGPDLKLSVKAGWPFGDIIQQHPELLQPHISALIQLMNDEKRHTSVKRNILRAFQFASIPEEFQGIIMEKCFTLLESPAEPPAVRAYSMTILDNLAESYPEIIPELLFLVSDHPEEQTPAFKARAKVILKKRKKKN